MSELTERLAAIREFADRPFTTGIDDADQHVCDQSADIQALLAGVEAVLELHEFDSEDAACGNPRHTNFDMGCPDCYYPCQGCGESYPCPTVQAIEKELDRHARH